jgi:hypothetical protein
MGALFGQQSSGLLSPQAIKGFQRRVYGIWGQRYSSIASFKRDLFTLSEYVREKRIPDAIMFDGRRLIALEVETEKRWRSSHASTQDRLSTLNSKCGFFDETKVVFPLVGESIDKSGPGFLDHLGFKKD